MIRAKDVITSPIPESADTAIYLPLFFYAEAGAERRLREIWEGDSTSSVSKADSFLSKGPLDAATKYRVEIVKSIGMKI